MHPQIKKILFASDLTETSRHAFTHATMLASRFRASIVFLHVMEDLPKGARAFLDEGTIEKIRKQAAESAQSKLIGKKAEIRMLESELNRFCQTAFEESVDQVTIDTDVRVLEGNVIETIISTTKEMNCDAIVMGSTRRGRIAEAMLGSVVKGVLRYSDTLVIVAPPK
ncbi:universal stress protein [uncultured Desulfosarcina sp.]|uniref:universal stress protein n=1 Tax=uncultured Desulfosarcina sp. TaxID=218289 RepID=UPI0029C6CCE2|nr:universal stress protein [uncultured Desulfosarcina sp.]